MPLIYPDTLFYIGSTSFTYGGSPISFTSKSFQSECYDITSVKENKLVPAGFSLEQNFPNPFNPSTKIPFEIGEREFVTLRVYNVLGQEVATLVNGEFEAGRYRAELDASILPAGVYFYRLQAGSYSEVRKMTLLK